MQAVGDGGRRQLGPRRGVCPFCLCRSILAWHSRLSGRAGRKQSVAPAGSLPASDTAGSRGLDRSRRPFQVLRVRAADGQGADPVGLRRVHLGAPNLWRPLQVLTDTGRSSAAALPSKSCVRRAAPRRRSGAETPAALSAPSWLPQEERSLTYAGCGTARNPSCGVLVGNRRTLTSAGADSAHAAIAQCLKSRRLISKMSYLS